MAKPFISYTEQIQKLQNDKKLNIENVDFALESLRNIFLMKICEVYFLNIHVEWNEESAL